MIAQSLSNKGNMKTQRNVKKTDGKKNAKKVQKLTVENGSKKKAVKRKIDFSDGPGSGSCAPVLELEFRNCF